MSSTLVGLHNIGVNSLTLASGADFPFIGGQLYIDPYVPGNKEGPFTFTRVGNILTISPVTAISHANGVVVVVINYATIEKASVINDQLAVRYGVVNNPPLPEEPDCDCPTQILVQPRFAYIGDEVLVASTTGVITDTARDDAFISGVNPARWSNAATNATTTFGGGLSVTLNKNGAGASYTLTSTNTYISGDVSIEYDILSDYMADAPAVEMVYAGLQMLFATGETLTIKRKSQAAGFGGQQVQVEYIDADGYNGGGRVYTTASSGKLRLLRHGSIIAAVQDHDEEPLFLTNITTTATFNIKIFSTTSGESAHAKARYRTYKSNTGVLLGTSPMISISSASTTRIFGRVPPTAEFGLVSPSAFNHSGQLGLNLNGFEYLQVLGVPLSRNDGITANVQSDTSLRA